MYKIVYSSKFKNYAKKYKHNKEVRTLLEETVDILVS